ncbi:POM152 [Candida theae]|uniref:POM152 n=1 Tax=Candida theae TaxID=1198502 RepID=A0AAD5BDP3_9ASCO|nr:POM152 [Candida theae]KAI5957493.1 POM152 [Candida theae]
MRPTDVKYRERRQSRRDVKPLIPSSILDSASQRLFVLSLFMLIQSWKIYDLVLVKSEIASSNEQLTTLTNFTFVLKYVFIDGVFLWLLPILRIPHLTFSPPKTLLSIFILNGITIFLVSNMALPLLSNIFLPIWRVILQKNELNIVGESINVANVIDMDSHFKGQLTIHYLPDSSAKMNPFHIDQTCLGSSNGNTVQMPIEFNTTSGIGFLQIQQNTANNDLVLHNYTGSSLKKLFKKDYSHLRNKIQSKPSDTLFYLEYPITEPGSYKIKSVLDKKGNSIRTYKSEFAISDCPSGKFFYPPNFDFQNNHKCLSSIEQETFPVPWLEVYGPSPAYVKLAIRANGNEFKVLNLTIPGDGDYRKSHSRTDFTYLKPTKLVRNSLEEAILQNIDEFKGLKETTVEFQLISVQDSFGNLHRYQPLSKDKDVWYKLVLRKSPSIRLVDPAKDSPLLLGGEKTLMVASANEFGDKDFPLEIVVSHNGSNLTSTFTSKIQLRNGITVTDPGLYKLVSARDAFCPCGISDVPPIKLELAEIPELNINAQPESDRCLGVVGYRFDFNFTGRAPFKVQYQIFSNNSGILKPVPSPAGQRIREFNSPSNQHSFKFKPPGEGSYSIVFSNIKDANYQEKGIALDEAKYTYSTYFRSASEVSLKLAGRELHTCYGVTAKVPVVFKGNGPFSFDYEYVDINTKKRFRSIEHVSEVSNYEIETPQSLLGKTYLLILSKAKDKFGCDAIINDNSQQVKIVSRPDVPELELSNTKSSIQIVEGHFVDVPLKYKSSIGQQKNDVVVLKHHTLEGKLLSKKRANLRHSSIRIFEEGIYSLEFFMNGNCEGKVVNKEKTVTVKYYDRPSMNVSSADEFLQHKEESLIHLKPVCNGAANEITLQLKGKAPFLIDYAIKLPSGKVETHTMNVEGHSIRIKLPTGANGQYEHTFRKIYDALYTRESKVPFADVPKVVYQVNRLPHASFATGKHFAQVCENKVRGDEIVADIPVKLSGEYPFEVEAILQSQATGENQKLKFRNIQEPHLFLQSTAFLQLGDYTLDLVSVKDGNGCINRNLQTTVKYIISITEPPNIFKSLDKVHYCVGDHVGYNLTGVTPITIFYQYDNVPRKAEVRHQFVRLASKPGILNIEALKDAGQSSCMVNFTSNDEKFQELQLQVHELPSVEVNKGDYIVEDIHQGEHTELIFTFTGEPPFKLTYIRTIEVKRDQKKVRQLLEKETVGNIWDKELVVSASLEGTYEAIEVQDKFCRAVKSINYVE